MTPDPKAAATVYFDGACPLCRREIGAYQRMRGMEDVTWANVAGDGATPEGLSREALLARFHARRADGEMISGARAFLAVWRRNPRLRPFARIGELPGVVHLLEGAYRVFLKIRPLWRKA